MTINCVWEHNGNDTLLYSDTLTGAYTRGENLSVAISKMPYEVLSYKKWLKEDITNDITIKIIQEKESDLNINDADSDVIFESEKHPITLEEYKKIKYVALKSASDFMHLYESIPDKSATNTIKRKTFYGQVPRNAYEMYEHTKNVNEYYFGEIGVDVNNNGNILECRKHGFDMLELEKDFLKNNVIKGSYGEEWSLRKVLRRFIWHDRIHAKAMWRLAVKLFDIEKISNPFYFN